MKTFYSVLIVFGILLILGAFFILNKEIKEAEEYCKSINGTYIFKFMHLCDEKVIVKYKSFSKYFWGYEADLTLPKEINKSFLD